jgi:hypothetical protein
MRPRRFTLALALLVVLCGVAAANWKSSVQGINWAVGLMFAHLRVASLGVGEAASGVVGEISATKVDTAQIRANDGTQAITLADTTAATVLKAASVKLDHATGIFSADSVHVDKIANEAGTGAPTLSFGATVTANYDIGLSGTGAVKTPNIEASDGTTAITIADTTVATVFKAASVKLDHATGIFSADTVGADKITDEAGTGAPSFTHGLVAAANKDVSLSGTGAVQTAHIESTDGVAAIDITAVTGAVDVVGALTANSVASDTSVSAGTSVTAATTLGADRAGIGCAAPAVTGHLNVATQIDVPTIEVTTLAARDGTIAATITNTTGDTAFVGALTANSIAATLTVTAGTTLGADRAALGKAAGSVSGVLGLAAIATPGSATEGDIYHDATAHMPYYYSGSGWVPISGLDTSAKLALTATGGSTGDPDFSWLGYGKGASLELTGNAAFAGALALGPGATNSTAGTIVATAAGVGTLLSLSDGIETGSASPTWRLYTEGTEAELNIYQGFYDADKDGERIFGWKSLSGIGAAGTGCWYFGGSGSANVPIMLGDTSATIGTNSFINALGISGNTSTNSIFTYGRSSTYCLDGAEHYYVARLKSTGNSVAALRMAPCQNDGTVGGTSGNAALTWTGPLNQDATSPSVEMMRVTTNGLLVPTEVRAPTYADAAGTDWATVSGSTVTLLGNATMANGSTLTAEKLVAVDADGLALRALGGVYGMALTTGTAGDDVVLTFTDKDGNGRLSYDGGADRFVAADVVSVDVPALNVTGLSTLTGGVTSSGPTVLTSSAVTVASGVIAVTGPNHVIQSEDTDPDDVTSISGGSEGQIVVLRKIIGGPTITLKNNASLLLGANIVLDHVADVAVLLKVGDVWVKIAAADNGS